MRRPVPTRFLLLARRQARPVPQLLVLLLALPRPQLVLPLSALLPSSAWQPSSQQALPQVLLQVPLRPLVLARLRRVPQQAQRL